MATKLGAAVHELRIHLSQTSAGSQGTRDWVLSTYGKLKQANPTLPILVREAENVKARIIARFDFGEERSVAVEGLDAAAVGKELEKLTSSKS
mmetsp:Transcript_10383/g.31266  ORF Transcript_10383/g.31266 Transcript_10383/m.31266 type:complete len:93 (+) Transcript_10383:254-532(+)